MAEAVAIDVEAEEDRYNERLLTAAFPELCPNMIGELVRSGGMDMVQMVTHLSGLDVEAQRKTIVEKARALMQKPENVEENTETKRKRKSSQVDKYTSEFNVEEFVALIPNPEEKFNKPTREIIYSDIRTFEYLERYFMNKYPSIYKTDISKLLLWRGETAPNEHYTLLEIDKLLASKVEQGLLKAMKCRRKPTPLKSPGGQILLLQELAYVEHRAEILDYIQKKKQDEAQRKQYAIDNGLTVTCQCCFTDGLMIEEAFTCNKDCSFCADCIQKSCELKLGEDNIQFPCLADCGSQFAWTTLQAALPPTLFSKLSLRCTESEIRAAGIKLDSCPSCNFTNIIDEYYTTFQCLNPDCMKETCRLCKEPTHLPLRCDEIEKDEEVKARVHIENKMTDALLRVCWRCNRKFIKDEDGCNKITCVCGAMSCYICNKPVESYKHFNGLGGDQHHLCPLYSDMDAMHQKEIAKAAEEAKKEVNPDRLKVDPSADINEYFEDKRKKTHPPRWMEAYEDIRLNYDREHHRDHRGHREQRAYEDIRLNYDREHHRDHRGHREQRVEDLRAYEDIRYREHHRHHREHREQRVEDLRRGVQHQVQRLAAAAALPLPAPVQRQAPAPAEPLPAPVQRQAPAPAEPLPAQVQRQAPAPALPLPAPVQRQAPAPAEPLPAPVQRQAPAPAQPLPAPVRRQAPAPAQPLPAPVQRHNPAPVQRRAAVPAQAQGLAPRQRQMHAPTVQTGMQYLQVPKPTYGHRRAPEATGERAQQVNNIHRRPAQVPAAVQAPARTATKHGRPAEVQAAGPPEKRVAEPRYASRRAEGGQPKPIQIRIRFDTQVRDNVPAVQPHATTKQGQSTRR